MAGEAMHRIGTFNVKTREFRAEKVIGSPDWWPCFMRPPTEADSVFDTCGACQHKAHEGPCLAGNGRDTPPIFCGCEGDGPKPIDRVEER